ncbi:MAG: pentapeptide repeat-containing protein [Sandaracinaceae bacterium]
MRGAHLVGVDLAGCDLTGCDLAGADLSRADLSEATLVGADLTGATLHETRLEGAELAGSRLVGARLEGALASRAGFGRADLQGASLFGARLDGASMVEVQLRGADLRRACLDGARALRADLRACDLTGASLEGADLTETRVAGASFREASLRRATLRGIPDGARASFVRADVRDVDFSGAYLLRRHVLDENFLDELRQRGGRHAALYWVWWVTSDCGRSLLRWGAWTALIGVAFGFAYRAVGVDFGDGATWLSPTYYSVVTLTSLGYGDIVPRTVPAQALAMVEVSVGYMMLGGLISIFANMLARRGE